MEDLKAIVYTHNDGTYEGLCKYFAESRVDVKFENDYMLLIGRRGKMMFANDIVQRYVNTIIHIPTLHIPVHTGGEFNYSYNKAVINNNFKEYKIYKMLDGTRISIWYDDRDQLVISTRKIIYANNVVWKGETYMNIFKDTLDHNGLSIDIFEHNKSYNMIIKHPSYHPFQQENKPIKSVHLINIFDHATHSLVPPHEFAVKHKMQYQEEIKDDGIKSIEDLLVNMDSKSIETYWATGQTIYGYIFRTTNYVLTKQYSNVIIYSRLYIIIKNSFYDRKKIVYYDIKDDNIYTRCIIVALSSEKGSIDLFIKLFPTYRELVIKIRRIIDNVVQRLIKYYLGNKTIELGSISSYFVEYIAAEYGLTVISHDKSVLRSTIYQGMTHKSMVKYITSVIPH